MPAERFEVELTTQAEKDLAGLTLDCISDAGRLEA